MFKKLSRGKLFADLYVRSIAALVDSHEQAFEIGNYVEVLHMEDQGGALYWFEVVFLLLHNRPLHSVQRKRLCLVVTPDSVVIRTTENDLNASKLPVRALHTLFLLYKMQSSAVK